MFKTQTWFINDFAKEIWQKKYAGDYTDPIHYLSDMADRVSFGNGDFAERVFNMLYERRFSPGGRILAGNGSPNAKVSWMNCTTHAIEEDTIESIAYTTQVVMRAGSRGQGIGIDISKLRPRGSVVNNSARTSTGAISFMELINHAGGEIIGQEGRRSALLFSIKDTHPDLYRPDILELECPKCNGAGCIYCGMSGKIPYDFLNIKKVNGRVTSANISVLISDDLMDAVKNDDEWIMYYEVDSSDGKHLVERSIKAKKLFRAIAKSAHQSAEPGTLFWDTTKRFSNSDLVGYPVTGVNACQPANALVLTPGGLSTFGKISIGDKVWDGNKFVTIINKRETGVRDVYEIRTPNGYFLGTSDHRVISHGQREYAITADSIDFGVGNPNTKISMDKSGIMDGLAMSKIGGRLKGNRHHLILSEDQLNLLYKKGFGEYILGAAEIMGENIYYIVSGIPLRTYSEMIKIVPNSIMLGSKNTVAGFLYGFISAEADIFETGIHRHITLTLPNKTLASQIQLMLSVFGISSHLERIVDDDTNIAEGYELILCSKAAVDYMKKFGLLFHNLEPEDFNGRYSKVYCPNSENIVRQRTFLGKQTVYDIEVDSKEHVYWTGGLIVSNCTEQLLDQDGVCNLGSLDLGSYVRAPFSAWSYFDYAKYIQDIHDAIHFLDNVLDIELRNGYHISKQQKESIIALRRVGLGVMGLADAIAMMGLKYDSSEETKEFLELIFSTLRDESYRASIALAELKGSAGALQFRPEYEMQDIVEKGFFKTLPQDIKDDIVIKGLRNVTTMCIAPTGSISNLYGVSSGIEPVFALEYTRRHRLNGDYEMVNYVHPRVELSRALGEQDDIWTTAYDVSPEDHVKIQATIQKYIDQSISKTCNMPASSTVEDVENIYMLAHDLGLKGIAVYVDGSRQEQVLYTKESAATNLGICPECGNESLINESGCKTCLACGWALCA